MGTKNIDWSKIDSKLGKVKDKVLAEEYGCSLFVVQRRRQRFQIPPQGKKREPKEPVNMGPPKVNLSAGRIYKFRDALGQFLYLQAVQGFHVEHHLFRSVTGQYCESFTPWQIDDYGVEEVA